MQIEEETIPQRTDLATKLTEKKHDTKNNIRQTTREIDWLKLCV